MKFGRANDSEGAVRGKEGVNDIIPVGCPP